MDLVHRFFPVPFYPVGRVPPLNRQSSLPDLVGCGSKPMVPFWLVGEFSPPKPIFVVGLVDVHWVKNRFGF